MWNVWVLGYMDRWYHHSRWKTEAALWESLKELKQHGFTFMVTFSGALPM